MIKSRPWSDPVDPTPLTRSQCTLTNCIHWWAKLIISWVSFSSVSPVIRRDTSLCFCKNCIKQFVYKDTSPAHNCEICLCLQLNSSIISSQGQSWCDADLSYPYSAKVKNGWNWAPLPLCTLTQCIGTVSPFISSKEVSCVESSTDSVNMYGG